MATDLQKGGNAALPAGPIRVEVSAQVQLDISALLVTEAGKVRDDGDFVFYNQPSAPGARYTPQGIEIDPAAIPEVIERVVVTASLDGNGPSSFGAIQRVPITITSGGTPVVTYTAEDLGDETALICVEVYRRQGTWKVRAVGQGWSSGLAGIATDFGISVEEETSATPVPGPPQATSGTPAPGPSSAAPSTQKVNLDKGKVSLDKRQTVSLTKAGSAPFERVAMGLGWDPARQGRTIDLDASVIVIGKSGKKVDTAWFLSKTAMKGAVRHSGDNLTGAGEGDDETIEVDLNKLPADVQALVFAVNSFQGQKFTEIARAFCRLIDRATGQELVRFDLTDSKPSTGVIMAIIHRSGATWDMTAVGEFHDGKTVRKMIGPAESAWREVAARP